MRKWLLGAMILVGLLRAIPLWADTQYPIAVLNFATTDKELGDMGEKVGILLSVQLSTQDHLIVIERQELEKALGEQAMGISGTVSPETAAKIGYLTGAKILITGRVFMVDRELMLVAKMIGVETSRVYGDTVSGSRKESIAKLVETLAGKVAKTVQEKGDTLVAKPEKIEDRIAKLKKMVSGKKLPTVSIAISEQSLGGPNLDPAAETELQKIFLQVGFDVVDRETTTKSPDVEISGAAFHEFGMRKNDLVSSKGRVEVKAIERLNGRILAADRQTEVAVDLSRETAGKSAIQNAAAILAERLIPELVK